MREDIEKRALEIGHYIVEKSATVRQTASVFRVSKSTVHKDVTEMCIRDSTGTPPDPKDLCTCLQKVRYLSSG